MDVAVIGGSENDAQGEEAAAGMIENYAEEVEMLPDEPQDASFATIGEVYDDGISLIFPGSEAASEKHYKCNQYCKFAAGQRVHVMKDSGTYVVMFPIGIPSSVQADTATTAQSAENATNATNATNAANATRAAAVQNQYNSAASYNVQFYAQSSNVLRFRLGTGTWYTLATT